MVLVDGVVRVRIVEPNGLQSEVPGNVILVEQRAESRWYRANQSAIDEVQCTIDCFS